MAFSIIALVCEFYPHGQTWYQKFIGTYMPLRVPCHFTMKREILNNPARNGVNGAQSTVLFSPEGG